MIAGDDSGATRKLIHLAGDDTAVFDGWDALIAAAPKALEISPAGVQFLLAYGMVPPPFTLYADVYALGIGDRLRIDGDRAEFTVDFPYLEARSTGREESDPARLEQLLVQAVARAIGDREPLLMQSAGKDSAALLIGLAGCKAKNVRAVTYRPHYLEDEAPDAVALAERFGIPHQVIDADPHRELELLLELCRVAPAICTDVALAAYLRALDGSRARPGVVLDGLGGDIYMGYVQPRQEALLSTASLPRLRSALWGRAEPRGLGAAGAYAFKSALMYPAERCLSGSHLSPRAVRELIPVETAFARHFERLDRRVAPMRPIDRRAYVRGRIYDGAGTMEKARLAAASIGAEVAFPFADRDLIAHYFNLPAAVKYDERRRKTKLPLRALLADKIGPGRFFEQKGSFRYDVLGFARENRGIIEDEIRAARRVLQDVERWLSFLTARIDNYVHAYSLFTLFMVAAWLNRRPSGSLVRFDDRVAQRSSMRVTVEP